MQSFILQIHIPLATRTSLTEPEMMMRGWELRNHVLSITSHLSPLMSIMINQYHSHTPSPEPAQVLNRSTQIHAKPTHRYPHGTHPRPFINLSYLPLSLLSLLPWPFTPFTLLWLLTDFKRLWSPSPSVELRSLLGNTTLPPPHLPPQIFLPL